MRRRPVGIGALQRDKQRLELFQQKGSLLAKEELDKLSSQMEDFRKNLEMFATKHKKEIKKSGEFRRHFQQMCAAAGVDPLKSSANYWVKLLGVGDFYFQLAIQINEVFLATSHKNGGILSMDELLSRVVTSRSASLSSTDSITADDIIEAIKKLSVLGGNVKVISSKNSYVIHATPSELNSDQTEVSRLAHSKDGRVTADELRREFSWMDERIDKALGELIMEGVVWIDNQGENGKPMYWFPSLRSEACVH